MKSCAMAVIAILCILAGGAPAQGANYYVAPAGNDSAGGAIGAPWRTIAHALSHANAGDTVFLRAGVYTGRITFVRSGSTAGRISLSGYPGETAVCDGAGLTVSNGWDALVNCAGQSHITIADLELRNFRTAVSGRIPIGVLIADPSRNITLQRLAIHAIENTFDSGGDAVAGSDAHGIAVYGGSAIQAITNLVVDSVAVYDCKLGSSEAMVFNGNVDGFTVGNCAVHDNNNIGIDFIGHEGTCPDPALDQVRNGLCSSNHVWNITTAGNPAYRNGTGYDLSAGGIYVDGGRAIVLERNKVHDCDIGIEVASEWPKKTAGGIVVRNNFIYRNHSVGLGVGGYDSARGGVTGSVFIGNTFYSNDTMRTWSGEIYLQWHITNCVFENNLLYAGPNSDGTSAVFVGGPGDAGARPSNTVFNYNLYYSRGANPVWTWGATEIASFGGWTGLGHDASGRYGVNPRLTAPDSGNLHIATNSPARNAGHTRSDAGALDIDGNTRIEGGTVDIGADEAASGAAPRVMFNDYDGDGRTDLGVFDTGSGKWYLMSLAGTTLAWGLAWGYSGVTALSDDYNGDSKSDLAVYDNAAGKWYVRSLAGATLAWGTAWGWNGATPLTGDYNGDGRADLAVFDKTTGKWFIRITGGAVLAWNHAWGWNGAVPVTGDFDGDGRTDLALFNDTTGKWFIKTLGGTILAWDMTWGWNGAVPVAGDYDGDHRDDLAVYNKTTGRWFIKSLSGSVIAWNMAWGWNGATPVPGDYDGDGNYDLAVYDGAAGKWYAMSLSGNSIMWGIPWGWPAAYPVGKAP